MHFYSVLLHWRSQRLCHFHSGRHFQAALISETARENLPGLEREGRANLRTQIRFLYTLTWFKLSFYVFRQANRLGQFGTGQNARQTTQGTFGKIGRFLQRFITN